MAEVRVVSAGGRTPAPLTATPQVRVVSAGGRLPARVALADRPSPFEVWDGTAWKPAPRDEVWTSAGWVRVEGP